MLNDRSNILGAFLRLYFQSRIIASVRFAKGIIRNILRS